MEKNSNFFKRSYHRVKDFFAHVPLFFKYLTIMTSLILVSYIVLSTALFLFISNDWLKGKKDTLVGNASENAEYCQRIIEEYSSEEQRKIVKRIICNYIAITSNATDSDMFVCNVEGKIVFCKEMSMYSEDTSEDVCLLHKGFTVPQDVMEQVEEGNYYGDGTVEGLFSDRTFLAGAPIIANGKVIGAVFAADHARNSFKNYAGNILEMYLSSAFFALALTFVVVYIYTAKLTNPLRQMSNATKAYAKGDFSKRVNVRGSDELAELCQSFNRMATRLSMLENSRRSFVANVSHELKTPMTTIGGFIDGMLDGTIPPERHGECLQIVSDESKRLSRLVTSMLNLSKIEAGELKLKYRDFDISSVIINCMLTFEQIIEQKNITVEGLENIGAVYIHADRDMIHQVIYNLVDNAVKFTDENGVITISVGENDNGAVSVSIQNTGEGISSEEIGRIFERFYKLDKSRSYDTKSAGLGLFLAKTIVEMHGGEIYAESVQGSYTRFTFVLGKTAD
ncbi:MAG: HAMP domain-containing protein [Oscillospiraceae bacterium]|nr:HAMP domain-containing protein [Oscillospiraceae bacterium]